MSETIEIDRDHATALEDAAVSLLEDVGNGRTYGTDEDVNELADALEALREATASIEESDR